MENFNFLKQKYNLHNTPEVEFAAKRTEVRSGEKIGQNPLDKIENYLNRFKEITDSGGYLSVFHVNRYDVGGRWLGGDWAKPGRKWDSGSEFVFARK